MKYFYVISNLSKDYVLDVQDAFLVLIVFPPILNCAEAVRLTPASKITDNNVVLILNLLFTYISLFAFA